MKRSAPESVNRSAAMVAKQPRHTRGRLTRSEVGEAKREEKHLPKEADRENQRLQKAQALMATPFLRALPFVVGSGFLYKWECRNIALTSRSCQAIVAEKHDELPIQCQVEIRVEGVEGEKCTWPLWVRQKRLEDVIPTKEFARAIFTKLCDLKVAAETSERKKRKVRESLPVWGVDFLVVHMLVWDANRRNDGGIYIFLTYRGNFHSSRLRGWSVRLRKDLVLWTWDSFRKWRKVYDYEPLWDAHYDNDDEEDSSDFGDYITVSALH